MTSQAKLDMPEVERLPRFEHYVRVQFIGEDGFTEPVSNIADEHWEPQPSRDPREFAEALAVCLELYFADHEVTHRTWVETWIRY